MKDMYEAGVREEILRRIARLTPDAPPEWGKMTVAQMMAHCAATLEAATGMINPPRSLPGLLFGSFARPSILANKPIPRKLPTDKYFLIRGNRNFELEKTRLVILVHKFSEGGQTGCTTHPHPFFGALTPMEWSFLMFKHLDHHLRQFSV